MYFCQTIWYLGPMTGRHGADMPRCPLNAAAGPIYACWLGSYHGYHQCVFFPFLLCYSQIDVPPLITVYIRAYAEQTVTERTDVYRSTRFFAPKMFFRSFKVTNANIETKLEQMCCIHTRLVVCAQEHNDFSGGSP